MYGTFLILSLVHASRVLKYNLFNTIEINFHNLFYKYIVIYGLLITNKYFFNQHTIVNLDIILFSTTICVLA